MTLFLLLIVFLAFAAGLAWFLIAHDHGEKEPVGALWIAAGLGFGGALLAGWLEGLFLSANTLLSATPSKALLLTTLAIGVIEEACKFVPLALFIYKKRYFNEHTDGVIYFALAGLGFGLPENILYTVQYGAKTGMVRIFLTPLFHAATTGMVGYYLARRKLNHKPVLGIAIPLAAAMLIHAMYDFGLASAVPVYQIVSLLISFGITASLFVLFVRAGDSDQDLALSTVGHNSFCRSCGWANPQHHLYCVHCGNNA